MQAEAQTDGTEKRAQGMSEDKEADERQKKEKADLMAVLSTTPKTKAEEGAPDLAGPHSQDTDGRQTSLWTPLAMSW